jgi:hypothetical protein
MSPSWGGLGKELVFPGSTNLSRDVRRRQQKIAFTRYWRVCPANHLRVTTYVIHAPENLHLCALGVRQRLFMLVPTRPLPSGGGRFQLGSRARPRIIGEEGSL